MSLKRWPENLKEISKCYQPKTSSAQYHTKLQDGAIVDAFSMNKVTINSIICTTGNFNDNCILSYYNMTDVYLLIACFITLHNIIRLL